MATLKVGSARQDENGKYSGGAAGDQTGKEVMIQNMYTHSKGWYVLRPKKAAHAKKIAAAMKTACNNANIGYDQGNRLAIVSVGTSTTTKTECDCSSLVRVCVKEGTGTDPGNFTTADEATKLAATGLFESKFSYVSQSSTPLYNGDILVTKTKGHTVIVVSGNARSTASSSSSSSSSIKAGKKLVLKTCPIYKSSTSASSSGTVSGTYYLWDATKKNGRYRITNKKANAGVDGAVTGWIPKSYV